MAQAAELEVIEIEGCEIKLRWKSSRFQEWLAWCYVPADSQRHNEGAGFEARGASPEEAKALCVERVREHLRGRSAGSG